MQIFPVLSFRAINQLPPADLYDALRDAKGLQVCCNMLKNLYVPPGHYSLIILNCETNMKEDDAFNFTIRLWSRIS